MNTLEQRKKDAVRAMRAVLLYYDQASAPEPSAELPAELILPGAVLRSLDGLDTLRLLVENSNSLSSLIRGR